MTIDEQNVYYLSFCTAWRVQSIPMPRPTDANELASRPLLSVEDWNNGRVSVAIAAVLHSRILLLQNGLEEIFWFRRTLVHGDWPVDRHRNDWWLYGTSHLAHKLAYKSRKSFFSWWRQRNLGELSWRIGTGVSALTFQIHKTSLKISLLNKWLEGYFRGHIKRSSPPESHEGRVVLEAKSRLK